MDKIVSSFYLISVDGSPVYVGYTNRPIKARFREHLKDKDFGEGEVTLEGLGKLSYAFTWDTELINQYAKGVSDKEAELVYQYGTQGSQWQKGTSESIGGQTWANVKYFVKTNRDNPKFSGMPEGEILEYLDTSDRVSRYLGNFIGNMDDPVAIYLGSFVGTMDDPVSDYMKGFVKGMNDPVADYLHNFVSNMDDPVAIYLKNFVGSMNDPVSRYMKDFVGSMGDPVAIYLKSFVAHMDEPLTTYMKSFVGNMNDPVARYMKDFVGSMNDHNSHK